MDDMTLPKVLQSPERDVLLVSALISILVVLAFTDWGVLAYVLTGLVFASLLLASAITNRSGRRSLRWGRYASPTRCPLIALALLS